ncbi:MAG TPA: L-threonylcarbamoyladenylate synthase [Casimicrobiaceae bacterium]|nr:L-threonylcarbamoyladenylate synthase [Casimicrobiaceae bacterium]
MSGNIVPADPAAIEAAARLLASGELVAFPTETVYGLGADAANGDAVRRIFTVKGRPADHPVIVHIADRRDVGKWARAVSNGAAQLAEAFWPGPLTLILPRAAAVLDQITGGQDSVGVRVPSHPIARALLNAFGGGIAAPSANRFGHVSPTTAAHVADDLQDAPAMILNGGPCDVGIESTIVAFRDDEPVLLRPGAISLAELTQVLGYSPRPPDAAAPRVSGSLALHYAPRTPASLVRVDALRAELAHLTERDEQVAVLARTLKRPDDFEGVWIEARDNAAQYARDLYANLRALDAANADAILIETPADDPAWFAVRDRLIRATQGEDDDRN